MHGLQPKAKRYQISCILYARFTAYTKDIQYVAAATALYLLRILSPCSILL
jgi:hypothetical protein